MSDILKWLGLPASIVLFAWACFIKLAPLLRAGPRLALVSWLLGQASQQSRWTATPVIIFDRLLARATFQPDAPPLFVRPSFRRSLLLTVVSIAIVILLGPVIASALCWGPDQKRCSGVEFYQPLLEALPYYGLSSITFLTCANAVIDYVCLCKTRLFLGLASRSRSVLLALLIPVLDIALTFLLWNLMFDIALLTWGFLSGIEVTIGVKLGWRELTEMYLYSIAFRSSDLFNVFLWSTMLTMVWMLVFVIGVTCVKLASAVQRTTTVSQRVFNLDDAILDRPLAVIGIASGMLLLGISVVTKVLTAVLLT